MHYNGIPDDCEVEQNFCENLLLLTLSSLSTDLLSIFFFGNKSTALFVVDLFTDVHNCYSPVGVRGQDTVATPVKLEGRRTG